MDRVQLKECRWKLFLKKSQIFCLDQNMKNDVNSQEMLCKKFQKTRDFFFYKFSAAFLKLTALHVKKKEVILIWTAFVG